MVVRRYHANARDVAVLGAYQHQCEKLRKVLDDKGERDVTVSSIRDSTGQLFTTSDNSDVRVFSSVLSVGVVYLC